MLSKAHRRCTEHRAPSTVSCSEHLKPILSKVALQIGSHVRLSILHRIDSRAIEGWPWPRSASMRFNVWVVHFTYSVCVQFNSIMDFVVSTSWFTIFPPSTVAKMRRMQQFVLCVRQPNVFLNCDALAPHTHTHTQTPIESFSPSSAVYRVPDNTVAIVWLRSFVHKHFIIK